MSEVLCSFHSVSLRRGEKPLLDDISFEVRAGELFGIASNDEAAAGAILRLIAGIETPTSGEVRVFGRDPTGDEEEVRTRLGLRLLPVRFVRFARAGEIVRQLQGLHGREDGRDPLAEHGLERYRDADASSLEPSVLHEFSLALARLHDPDLMLLENPGYRLTPGQREALWDRLGAARDGDRTVVFSTGYAGETHLCDRVMVLDGGRAAALGTPAEILRQHASTFVVEFTAGDGFDAEGLRAVAAVRDLEASGAKVRARVDGIGGVGDVIDALQAQPVEIGDFRAQPARLQEAFLEITQTRKGSAGAAGKGSDR